MIFPAEHQEGVNHVLEHARTRDIALLGDVTHKNQDRSRLLCALNQARRYLSHLGDTPWQCLKGFAVHDLDRINNQDVGLIVIPIFEYRLERGLGRHRYRVNRQFETLCAKRDLRQALLARNV